MYSFVLQHPENRIVIPIISPKIYLAAAYKIYKHPDGIQKVEKLYNIILPGVEVVKDIIMNKFKKHLAIVGNVLRIILMMII